MKLSLIVPCYNEEKNIEAFFDAVTKVFIDVSFSYEIIFVNDGSKDNTLIELKKIYQKYPEKIQIVSFSRNFGKEAGILAGLKHSTGEYVSLIDADLQQRPEIVKEMVNILDNSPEYDCVTAYQKERKEGFLLTKFKNLFYQLINHMCEIEFVSGASDFRTFKRSMVEAVLNMPEYFRFSKGIFSWIGFSTYYMPYQVEERNAGQSKWSFWKLFKYALEGIFSFTTVPLELATVMGAFTSFLSILYLVIVVIQKLAFSIDIPGYATIIVLILFLGGIQLLILGIIGEYLARTYIQGKNRPIYIEKEVLKRTEKNE